VKILFLARHYTYFRNFEAAIRLLAEHGHRLHLAVDRGDGESIAHRLAGESARVTFGLTPRIADSADTVLAESIRLGLDYLRYQDAVYDEAPIIRQRASIRTPRAAAWAASVGGRERASRWLRGLERAVPPPDEVMRFLHEQRPDLILLTPLIELGSPQVDYLRAAKALGIRTALCVWSWDHLSSKALIRERPDRVLVWNMTQAVEAREQHAIPSSQIAVTGAQCFDQWFDREPSKPRPAFCRHAGLAGDRPFILYVCSALFKGTLPEAPFVREWLRALRSHGDPAVRDVPVLVRPHPQRMPEWDGIDLAREFHDVAWFGSNPIDAESRADYFDSLFHAAAVVGLNTSALIEAAIVDRPVYTVLLPQFHDNQEGTFHFRYLLRVGDGFLHVSRSLDEHAAQLADGLRGHRGKDNRRFVEAFIRPQGLDQPSTPRFVDVVESLPSVLPVPLAEASIRARAVASVLRHTIETPLGTRWLADPRRGRERAGKHAVLEERQRRQATKRADRDATLRRRSRRRLIATLKTAVLRTGLVSRQRGKV
jgi:hypothetical protein